MINRTGFFLLLLAFHTSLFAQNIPNENVFAPYMQAQALVWDSIAPDYYTGAMLGNGLLGTNIYKENDRAVRFDIGRSDVADHRAADDPASQNKLFGKARLSIGRMLIETRGRILTSHMRLDIYNAEASGEITTDSGAIRFTAIVFANSNIIYLQASGTAAEQGFDWTWRSDSSISPRALMKGDLYIPPQGYRANPSVERQDSAGISWACQGMLGGGGYATVWKRLDHGIERSVAITVGYDSAHAGEVKKKAINILQAFQSTAAAISRARQDHRQWWHAYFRKSFVSLPDKRLEAFYWVQLYKLASATRPDKPMIDLMGPWAVAKTPWPAIWWNLNVQLTYSPIYVSNHLDLGFSLYRTLDDNLDHLIQNAPGPWQYNSAAIARTSSYDLVSPVTEQDISKGSVEPANLAWVMFYYYKHYLYTGDTVALRAHIYPLLKRSVNFMVHLLKKDDQGIYHLPLTFSPEYKSAEDANYTLAALRWGTKALLQADSILHLKDPELIGLRQTIDALAPYPVNETGFMIGKDIALTNSHRHYSHLMMIYPYGLMDPVKDQALIETSLEHWLSLTGALQGYTFTGSASMYALLGKGHKAVQLLNQLMNKYIQPNTLYRESGPVIETPLAAASSLLDLLLQSHDGGIRIFPAVPEEWREASFADLRAEGNFTVSATRKEGRTCWVNVESNRGGICKIFTDIPVAELVCTSAKVNISESNGLTCIEWTSMKSQVLVLSRKNTRMVRPGPAEKQTYDSNFWGLKRAKQ